MSLSLIVIAGLCLAFAASAFAADLYVSPTGADAAAGTKDKPLASLAGARDAVRKLRQQNARRNIVVEFADGVYRLDKTVVFGLEDSAADGFTITYRAAPGQRPVFSAGVPVTGWKKVAQDPADLAPAARGKLWVADVPAGLSPFHTLFAGEKRLPRARQTGFTPTAESKDWGGNDQQAIHFPAGAMKRWPNLADVEVSIVTAAPWTMNVLPIESVDEAAGVARTAIVGTYSLAKPRFGRFQAGSVFIENTFGGLDEPGKWVLDSAARKLYLWPAGEGEPRDILAPCLTELVRVEGRIDFDGPADEPVRGLVFRGLTFRHGERFTWAKDHAGRGLQHDWEMYDAPSAMLRFRGAERCAVRHCELSAAGGTAIRLDLHARDIEIAGNLIQHVGGAGVLLAGYGPGTKDVNNGNRVTGNHIHHVGETYWHSSAIWAWQSGGNTIANNRIHNTPYSAICVTGRICMDPAGGAECAKTVRWGDLEKVFGSAEAARRTGGLPWKERERFLHARKNVVEHNDISGVMEVMEDGNCIYVSGCGDGNVVRQNWLHDCDSIHMAEGIRCDDDQHGTLIEGNVLYRIGGLATYIAIKGVNHITDNIMAVPAAQTFRGMLSLEHTPIEGSIIQRNIIYAVHAGDIPCYQGTTYYKTVTRLADTKADNNVWFNAADPAWGRKFIEAERANGVEKNSSWDDPLFVDAAHGDLRLKPESPALKLGFKPFDTRQAGLKEPAGPGND